jgi:hypothetical protein
MVMRKIVQRLDLNSGGTVTAAGELKIIASIIAVNRINRTPAITPAGLSLTALTYKYPSFSMIINVLLFTLILEYYTVGVEIRTVFRHYI